MDYLSEVFLRSLSTVVGWRKLKSLYIVDFMIVDFMVVLVYYYFQLLSEISPAIEPDFFFRYHIAPKAFHFSEISLASPL